MTPARSYRMPAPTFTPELGELVAEAAPDEALLAAPESLAEAPLPDVELAPALIEDEPEAEAEAEVELVVPPLPERPANE